MYSQNTKQSKDTNLIVIDTVLKHKSDTLKSYKDTIKTDSLKVKVNKNNANTVDFPIDYTAKDSIISAINEQKLFLYGNAQINYKDIELKANYIELDLKNSFAFAKGIPDSTGKLTGNPVFTEGGDKFDAKTIKYNFKTKKGIITGVITEQSGGFLHGEKTKKLANNEICLKNGLYTTCDLEHPHFYIDLTKAKVIPDDKIVTGPAYLVIADVPLPIGIPFGFFPNKKGNASGVIIPEYGNEENRGFFLKNGGYYFALGKYIDLKLLGDIYSNSSWGGKVQSNYVKRYKFKGYLDIEYSSLKLSEKDLFDYKETNTFWFKWSHQQDSKAHPNSNFSANVNLGSTKYNEYNSNYTDNFLQNTMQSSISYSKVFPNSPFNISTNLRHSQNNLDSTVSLSIPEINISMNRIYPFKRKNKIGKVQWYENIGLSYTSNFSNTLTAKEKDIFSNKSLSKFKNGIKHNIPVSTSFKVLKYFTINPTLSYTERWYFKSISKEWVDSEIINDDTIAPHVKTDTVIGFKRAGDYVVSVPLTTTIYGMYQFKRSNIKAIRHVITPSVSYSYRPDYGEDKWGYYKTVKSDTTGKRTKYSIFDGGAGAWSGNQGYPSQGKSGLVNININNNVEMKVKNKKDTTNTFKKVSIFDNLTFNTSYNIAVDSLNWSPLTIQGRTKLFKIIDLSFNSSFNEYNVDSSGNEVNKYVWETPEKFLRFESANLSLGMAFSSKNNASATKAAIDAGLPNNYLDDYVDFKIPWTLRIDYSLRYDKTSFVIVDHKFDKKITQTVNFSGDFNLTGKWKIGYSSGYDFETKKLTYTSIDIYRDLHCWEMSFKWVPFGTYKSYIFQINVKSSVLQDLKLNRRKNWTENL